MITLGIETSCDESAVCLIRNGKVLAESVASSASVHSKYGGVVPEVASRRHLESTLPCLDDVLSKSGIKISQIDLIAATAGPGLLGAVLIGTSTAKSLAIALNKPLVFVDHVLAHAYAGQIGLKKPRLPFLGLVVSGGHTLLLHWRRPAAVAVLGQTLDDAAGEVFDKVAQMLGWGYPGGPVIEQKSKGITPDPDRFPKPMIKHKKLDFSFSGLKTSVYYEIGKQTKKSGLQDSQARQIASDFQDAVCQTLALRARSAWRLTGTDFLTVGGGVSANRVLQRKILQMAEADGIDVCFPDISLCTDNAVMIAFLGQSIFCSKKSVRAFDPSRAAKYTPYPGFLKGASQAGSAIKVVC